MDPSRRLLVASAALLCIPGSLRAQPPATVPRIGLLATGLGSPDMQVTVDAVRAGLREHGYLEGKTIRIEYRSADGVSERLPALAAELVGAKVDLIIATATPAARAAQRATSTIPIVAIAIGDPVGDGLVASLGRPGANLTGTTFLGPKLVPKHLELLKETLPGISRVAVLRHPGAFADRTMAEMAKETGSAAELLKLRLRLTDVKSGEELDTAFVRMSRDRPEALVVFPSTLFFFERKRIAALTIKHRLPTMFNNSQSVELGGMIGYGANLFELARQSAGYVARILKGAKPADLPVQQPTKFELVVNLKTAKVLGITVPRSILLRADRVIE